MLTPPFGRTAAVPVGGLELLPADLLHFLLEVLDVDPDVLDGFGGFRYLLPAHADVIEQGRSFGFRCGSRLAR